MSLHADRSRDGDGFRRPVGRSLLLAGTVLAVAAVAETTATDGVATSTATENRS